MTYSKFDISLECSECNYVINKTIKTELSYSEDMENKILEKIITERSVNDENF